jgi:hypothetical protein
VGGTVQYRVRTEGSKWSIGGAKDMQNEYENRILENLKTLQALRAKAASQVTIDELGEELKRRVGSKSYAVPKRRRKKTMKQLSKTLRRKVM